jgi:hypothetical protein
MPTTTPAHYPRTKGESLLDLAYALELSVLSQRFYERLHKGIAFVSLLAGSVAFVTIFHPNSVVVTVAGLLVGILALVEQVYDFRGKGMIHAALVRRYLKLSARSAGLTLEKLDAAQAIIAIDTVPVIQGLRRLAANNNLRRHGYEDRVKPLTRWEGLLNLFV